MLRAALAPLVVAATALVAGVPSMASAQTTSGYLPGIDVSHWQGAIDWPKVAASGQRFVIAKATEGQTYNDDEYATNKAGATAAGLAFTAYHFARPDSTANDAVLEADHFVSVAQLGAGNLLPALDLEKTGGLDTAALTAWVWAWLQEVDARLGVKPMIYTGPYFWRTYMGDTAEFADAGYKVLWIANWNVSSPSVPASDWGGNGWTFWQYSDCGTVPGISGCVDTDWFNGTDFGRVRIRQITVTLNAPDGLVTSAPSGIDCGATCTANFDPGATVTLTPTPNPGAVFIGWGGACAGAGAGTCTLTMNANRTVTATFGFVLTTSLSGAGVGTVTSTPAGIDCGSSCSAAFPTGTAVTLTPTADPGMEFSGWSGDCSGTGSCAVTLDAAHTVTATFIDDVPPTVTLAAPSQLTGAVTARFSEIVHKVTRSDFVLRAGGSTANVAAAIECRSSTGTSVDCSTGDVTVATLRSDAPLIPGQRYTAIVDPDGVTTQIVDRGGNPVAITSQAFTAATALEQGNPAVRYAWRTVSNHSAFGGSYEVEHLAGARVTYLFTGSSVTWYTMTGPSQGRASVVIDGHSRGTFDQYASAFHYRISRAFTHLGSGEHSITINVLGKRSAAATDTQVAVDAFAVGGTVHATPATAASWQLVRASKASGGSFAESDLAGSSVSLTFRGTAIDWYEILGPNRGRARVFVDGKLLRTEDDYAATVTYGVRRRVANLADRVHTLRIVVLGEARAAASGRLVTIDRFVVH